MMKSLGMDVTEDSLQGSDLLKRICAAEQNEGQLAVSGRTDSRLGLADTSHASVTDMRDEDLPPELPSPDTANSGDTPSRLHRTLHRLSSPFRSGSPFHIGSIKRTGSTKSSASDSEGQARTDTRKEMRKKNKKSKHDSASNASKNSENTSNVEKRKKEGAGSFVRRLGSIRRRRGEGSPVTMASTEASSQSSSVRDIEEPVDTVSTETQSTTEQETPPAKTPEPAAPEAATETRVTFRPFTKIIRNNNIQRKMEKPVEEPSPESAIRRRIAFVAQASTFFSEDQGDEVGSTTKEVGSLAEAVALARVRLGTVPQSATPSQLSRGADTEEEAYDDAMPPYGDLIEPDEKASNEASTSSSHGSAPGERREHLYKILVIGELGTGKTSIIKRYVHQFFSQHYRATIGVDFALKVLNWDANTIIRLQLWDIAGQERFGNMTRVYYKEAVGAFIVFDVTRAATFDAVVKWKTDLDAKVQLPDGSPIPCVLLANKCDQQKEGIVNTPAKMEEYCREKGFAGWFETSAKENINIEEAARSLVNKILLNDKLLQNNDIKDSEKFALDHKIANGENSGEGTSKNCSC